MTMRPTPYAVAPGSGWAGHEPGGMPPRYRQKPMGGAALGDGAAIELVALNAVDAFSLVSLWPVRPLPPILVSEDSVVSQR